jgi:peptide/nickel transport system permease protein
MVRYIAKRLLSGFIILFLFQTALFFAVQIILPGDFASQYAMMLSPDQIQELRHQLNLDLPLWERYLNWVWNLVRGDLGRSYSLQGAGPDVLETLKAVVPPTILVFGVGTALAFLLGLWLGKVTAWRGPGLVSSSITFGSIALYTSFPPWLAFLLVYFLTTQLGILPGAISRQLWRDAPLTTGQVMAQMVVLLLCSLAAVSIFQWIIRRLVRRSLPVVVFLFLTGAFWVAGWRLLGIFVYAVDIARAAALPLVGYVLLSFGEMMLVMRTTMLDVMHEQYVLTAQAKGLRSQAVRDRHVARNAILPVLGGLVIRLPYLLTGAAMIEKTLNWEGVGTKLFYAVGYQDIMLAMGLILVIGLISLGARLLLDILQALLDPRIHLGSGQLKGL